ncbi:MAG TPA: class I SAM-dependent methyltransferase [Rhabdochlamydiaceae bacterium]
MNLTSEKENFNRSHAKTNPSFQEAVLQVKNRIKARGDLPHVSVQRQLELVDQLCEFPFGRHTLETKGANGFWTDYLISPPKNQNPADLSTIENYILNRSLIILAHRERFRTYQNVMQSLLKEGIVLASVPCGLMRDLITLDFSHISNFNLVGIDIDQESLDLAAKLAKEWHISNVALLQLDAWQMDFKEEFDVLTSSGLNVYESDPEKVLDLYRRFYNALKPGGSLIISVLTYPPGDSNPTEWALENIDPEDLLMEQVLYKDILNLNWRNFRSADEIDREFKLAGFSQVDIIYDQNRIFPTVVAHKAL